MKRWVGFILCVMLSFSVWLVHNLSRMYTDVVSVNISAMSNIDGFARNSISPATVTARCRCSGFKLLDLKAGSDEKIRSVFIDRSDFTPSENDMFSIGSATLYKYVADIFGQGVTVESFVSSKISFRFAHENYKRVPVTPVKVLSFKPQYCSLGEMRISPDSVTVYAEPSRLESLSDIRTEPITVRDIRGNINGVAKLERLQGVRVSDVEVSYSLDVTRYVDVTGEIRIDALNLPEGKTISIFPSVAKVVLRCPFPLDNEPFDDVHLYVDYNEFVRSINGYCVIRCSELPASVISCVIDPEVCSCVENGGME